MYFYFYQEFIQNLNIGCHLVMYTFMLCYSAPPPPLQAAAFSRGVVTMRCDISTCSAAHISLLVSGSAHTCFNDQVPSKCLCTMFFITETNKCYLHMIFNFSIPILHFWCRITFVYIYIMFPSTGLSFIFLLKYIIFVFLSSGLTFFSERNSYLTNFFHSNV